MHNPMAMSSIQCVGHFDAVAQGVIQWQRPFRQARRERFPFQVFHHQVIGSILVTDVEQGADVGMLQRGNGPRFPLEALFARRVGRKMRWGEP